MTVTSNQGLDNAEGDVDDVGVVLRQSVSLSLTHTISNPLRASLFGDFTRIDFLEDAGTAESDRGQDDYFWAVGARASYALTRVLSFSVVYAYLQRDSNRDEDDFNENRATLTLSGRFAIFEN